jgi:hypothetical protein
VQLSLKPKAIFISGVKALLGKTSLPLESDLSKRALFKTCALEAILEVFLQTRGNSTHGGSILKANYHKVIRTIARAQPSFIRLEIRKCHPSHAEVVT